jgi:Zn-dependent alcohol dehydrogenase
MSEQYCHCAGYLPQEPRRRARHCCRLPPFTEQLDIPDIMLLQEKKLTGSIYGSCAPHIDCNKIASLGESATLDFCALAAKATRFPRSTRASQKYGRVN